MSADRKMMREKSHMRPYRVAVWFHTLGILHRVWDNNNLEVASIKTYAHVTLPATVASDPLGPYACKTNATTLIAIITAIAKSSTTTNVYCPRGASMAAMDPLVVVLVKARRPPPMVKPSSS